MGLTKILSLLGVLYFASGNKFTEQVYVNDENHWYILLSASKFYFNYRHTANTLAVYHTLKNHGIRDDRVQNLIF
jgi:glycosylphosphatidylinositol transamidase (GPIT) subunit GPI8